MTVRIAGTVNECFYNFEDYGVCALLLTASSHTSRCLNFTRATNSFNIFKLFITVVSHDHF